MDPGLDPSGRLGDPLSEPVQGPSRRALANTKDKVVREDNSRATVGGGRIIRRPARARIRNQ